MNLNLPDLPGAACKNTPDPDVFFPRVGNGRPNKWSRLLLAETKEMCGHCPARLKCLEWALANDEQGIWGGTTDEQRRTMRNKPLTQEQRRRAVRRLHGEGLTDGPIAEQLKVSRSVIQNDRNVLGLDQNHIAGPEITERRVKVTELHGRGLNDLEIARVLGITRDKVRHDRTHLGLGQNFRTETGSVA